ncbi:MAG: flagellar basal body L-ring protein FlgH [Leptospiraceae bacterium]|nr:flagellar basal body L-ring protein FlgH [Leptospiraceae bacterium]
MTRLIPGSNHWQGPHLWSGLQLRLAPAFVRSALYVLILICLFFYCQVLSAQSLWQDHNPYSPSVPLPAGSILKLQIDEPVKIEYEYEDHRDRLADIKLVPDKTLTDFFTPVDTNHSVVQKNKSKLKSKSRLQMQIAVTVIESNNENVLQFRGTKVIAQESGKQAQQIQVSGRIARSDIGPNRSIQSGNVADLVIQVRGAPVANRESIDLTNQNGQGQAELSAADKQRLLLEYLNRALGEGSVP